MTESGSSDDDDPQLRAMRSVWLAMPDEDPPSRGLAELMAAARVKAEELSSPPWWKRVADLLRRPTVLALASVMVLIGGAVLVSQRKDLSEAPARQREVGSAQNVAPAEGRPAAAPMQQDPQLDKAKETEAAQKPSGGKTPVVTATPPPTTVPTPPKPVVPRPSPQLQPPPTHAGFAHHTAPRSAPESQGALAQPAPATEDTGAKDDDGDSVSGTRGPTQVLVGQLLEQCRSAATRGDCEAAKLIAKRIAKQDAGYYRDHVATDATISKCFAAAAE